MKLLARILLAVLATSLWLCDLTVGQPLVVRGSLSLTPRTCVVARDSLVYTGGANSLVIANVSRPDCVRVIGQAAADGATLVAAELEGDYVYAAGQAGGLLIYQVGNPGSPNIVARFSSGNVKDVAVHDTLVVLAATSFVALVGVRDRARPHVLASYGRSASWAEIESNGRMVHIGSPSGAYRLEIRTTISGGDTNFSFAAGPQYGDDNVSPVALVNTSSATCLDVVRTATLQTILASNYVLIGQYLASAPIRGLATGLQYCVLVTSTGTVVHLDQSGNSPLFRSSADVLNPGNGIAVGTCREGDVVAVAHANGLTALTFGVASADHDRRMPIADSHALSAYPNPFNSVVNLEFSVPHEGQYNLEIFDILGRSIHSERLTLFTTANSRRFDFGGHPSGLYLARLRGPEGSAMTRLLYMP